MTAIENSTEYLCKIVTLVCAEPDASGEEECTGRYEVQARLLPDGRLLTMDANSGDSLWASVEDYQPNGLARCVEVQVSDETDAVTVEAVIAADASDKLHGATKSHLTEAEWDARPWPREYELNVEGNYSTLTADSLDAAIEDAREAAGENWETRETTMWVDWRLTEKAREGADVEVASGTVQIDPEEPDCSHDDGHDWRSPYSLLGGLKENPGVHGHGGGVIITDLCVRCGCKRVRDTWAQRPDTGEQGLDSVEYEPGAYEIDNRLEAIQWDGNIGKWCGRWFCRAESGSYDTEAEARHAQGETSEQSVEA